MGEDLSFKKFGIIKNIALVTQLGLSMALPVVAGVYIGAWLDKRFETQPLFLLVCLIVFSIGSFVNLFKLAGVKKRRTIEDVDKKNIDLEDEK